MANGIQPPLSLIMEGRDLKISAQLLAVIIPELTNLECTGFVADVHPYYFFSIAMQEIIQLASGQRVARTTGGYRL